MLLCNVHVLIVVPPVESVIVDCFRHHQDDGTCISTGRIKVRSLEAIEHMSFISIGLGMVTALH